MPEHIVSFQQALLNPDLPVITDLSSSSNSLVVALGGGIGLMGVTMGAFANAIGAVDKKRIFLRDTQQMYYFFGVPGLGENIPQIVDSLRRIIQREKIDHLTMVGNCMSGHTAIVLGLMLGADVIHAFSPKTTIKWYHRLLFLDFPSLLLPRNMIWRTNFADPANKPYLDLKFFMQQYRHHRGAVHIYIDNQFKRSKLHANRLKGFPQVTIHPAPVDRDKIIRSL